MTSSGDDIQGSALDPLGDAEDFEPTAASPRADEALELDFDDFDEFDSPDAEQGPGAGASAELTLAWQALEAECFRTGGAVEQDRLTALAARFALSAVDLARLRVVARDHRLLVEASREGVVRAQHRDASFTPSSGALDDDWFLRRLANAAPLLTAQDERELAMRYEAGEQARVVLEAGVDDDALRRELERVVGEGTVAKERFVLANLRLVMSIARRARGQGLDYPDLVSEGILGLTRAVEKFNYRLGHKFSTYATWWIRQSTQRALADKGRLIRLPVHVVEKLRKIQRARRRLEARLGREPTALEIAEASKLDLGDVVGTLAVAAPLVYGDEAIGSEGGATLLEAVPDESIPVEEQAISDAFEAVLLGLLHDSQRFQDRERVVLEHRLEIGDADKRTLEELAKQFDVTRERVRQIETGALKKLRAALAPWRADFAELARPNAADATGDLGRAEPTEAMATDYVSLFSSAPGLTPDERAVIDLRYLSEDPLSVDDTAARLGATRDWVLERQRGAWLKANRKESE